MNLEMKKVVPKESSTYAQYFSLDTIHEVVDFLRAFGLGFRFFEDDGLQLEIARTPYDLPTEGEPDAIGLHSYIVVDTDTGNFGFRSAKIFHECFTYVEKDER